MKGDLTKLTWLGCTLAMVACSETPGMYPTEQYPGPPAGGPGQPGEAPPGAVSSGKTADGTAREYDQDRPEAAAKPAFSGESITVQGELLADPGVPPPGMQIQMDLNGVGPEGGHYNSTFLLRPGAFALRAPKELTIAEIKVFVGDPRGDPANRVFYVFSPVDLDTDNRSDLTLDMRGKTLTRVGDPPAAEPLVGAEGGRPPEDAGEDREGQAPAGGEGMPPGSGVDARTGGSSGATIGSDGVETGDAPSGSLPAFLFGGPDATGADTTGGGSGGADGTSTSAGDTKAGEAPE